MTNIDGLRRHDVDAFGTRIHVAEVGEGPLVLFVHGFPESWYSWRNQLPTVAEYGWRAAAIETSAVCFATSSAALVAFCATFFVIFIGSRR